MRKANSIACPLHSSKLRGCNLRFEVAFHLQRPSGGANLKRVELVNKFVTSLPLRLGIIAITVAAWLSIWNHCALAAIRKSSCSHMSCHEKSHSPAKQSEDAPFCKVLRATLAKVSQPVVDLSILTGQTYFAESILFPQQQRLLGNPLALDTGPPFSVSFAESVLQRSMLAHAPPAFS